MTNRYLACLGVAAALTAFVASPALAQSSVKVGTLTCDVSAGIGLLISQQQTMTCNFAPASGGPPDNYTGRIDKFGLIAWRGAARNPWFGGSSSSLHGISAWGVSGNLWGRRRRGDRGLRVSAASISWWVEPAVPILATAPFRPGSDRAQFRRRGHDPDAHLGALDPRGQNCVAWASEPLTAICVGTEARAECAA